MFRSIIVPLDGSAFGDYALPFAASIARRTGAALKLVHVHHSHAPGAELEGLPQYQFQHIAEYDLHADEDARNGESDRMWKLADEYRRTGVTASAHVLSGRIPDAIAGFARDSADALIVMTTHGRSGFERLWLGSVADAVVRHSLTPVLLLRPPVDGKLPPVRVHLERALIPVDGSTFSSRILGPLTDLAGDEPMEVTLFEATMPPVDAAAALSPVWTAAQAAAAEAGTDEFLGSLRDQLPDVLVASAKRVSHRQPALAILEEAEGGDYDVIAMATHGRGGAHHLLLGSTADKVMRGTDRPILLFRPLARATHRAEQLVAETWTIQEVVITE